MIVLADSAIPFLKGVLEPYAEVRYKAGSEISKSDLEGVDALLVRTRTKANANLLEGSNVKFIATATIGTDHFDIPYLNQKKIFWTNAPGCNEMSVAQYVASALSSFSLKTGEPLAGKTVGIVGVGHVGSSVLCVLWALGMKPLLCDPPRAKAEGPADFVTLDELLEKSDIVTLHVPLIRSGENPTYHMGNSEFFQKMKKGAWFLNASRGEVVETEAVKAAIQSQKLSAVALDVWEHEPEIDRDLLNGVDFGTPHVAGYSRDGKANATTQIVRSFGKFFGIEPLKKFVAALPQHELILECDASKDSNENNVKKLILETYDIARDSVELKTNPSNFEKIRNNYPIRREPIAYKVRVKNANVELRHMLKNLGFTVISE